MEYKERGECCLCGGNYDHYGNNPAPLGDTETERCCDNCNILYVVAARIGWRIDPVTAPEHVL